jgi:cysteine desulfurase
MFQSDAKVLQRIAMKSQRFVYLDNNATTQVAPEVVEAMLPFLTENWATPRAPIPFGQIGRSHSTREITINAEPREIVFTSCGTESNNAAIHSALSQPQNVMWLPRRGTFRDLEVLPLPQKQDFRCHTGYAGWQPAIGGTCEFLRPDTAIVSTMWANNETA